MRNQHTIPTEENPTNTPAVLLTAVKALKNKEHLRNCHYPEKHKETWQLNAVWPWQCGMGICQITLNKYEQTMHFNE